VVQIYEAIALHRKLAIKYHEPADITSNALSGSCNVCLAALNRFCELMGTFAGNLALNLGTHGGVYIAGGIAQRFVDFLKASDFRARFEAKGRFQQYVADIPTFVITEPDHGLIGAAAYLDQNFKG
jgi:glucokinase